MLFMTIYTYKPANRDAVIKRRLEKGPQLPPEVKSVGEWSYTAAAACSGSSMPRTRRPAFKASYAWSDLGTIETYPVLEVDAVMKMVGAK